MRWYYLSHFTRYRLALEKIPLHTVDKHDALGDQTNQRGVSLSHETSAPLTDWLFQAPPPEMPNLPTTLFPLVDAWISSSAHLLLPFLLM